MLVQVARTRGCLQMPEQLREQRPLGHSLTERTAVGRAVDLDPVAYNHQVGGHLRALVRLHLDVLPILIARQFLQVAHPLTCGGFHDRKLAEASTHHGRPREKRVLPHDSPSVHSPEQRDLDLCPQGIHLEENSRKLREGSKAKLPTLKETPLNGRPLPPRNVSLPILSRPLSTTYTRKQSKDSVGRGLEEHAESPVSISNTTETKHRVYASTLEMEAGGLDTQRSPWLHSLRP